MKRQQLDNYTRCVWFLKELFKSLIEKIIRKNIIDFEDFSIMKFQKVYDQVLTHYETVKNLKKFSLTQAETDELSRMIDEYRKKTSTIFIDVIARSYVSLVIAQLKDNVMNDLTKQFFSLALFIQAQVIIMNKTLQDFTTAVSVMSTSQSRALYREDYLIVLSEADNFSNEEEFFESNQCYFCEAYECWKFTCSQLSSYKARNLIHTNDMSRVFLESSEQGDKSVRINMQRSQKELVDLALKQQRQSAKRVSAVRLINAQSDDDVEDDDDIEKKEDWKSSTVLASAIRQKNTLIFKSVKKSLASRIDSKRRVFKKKTKQEKRLSEIKNLRIEEYSFDNSKMSKSTTVKNATMKDVKEISRKFKEKKFTSQQIARRDSAESVNKDRRVQNKIIKMSDSWKLSSDLLKQTVTVKLERLIEASSTIFRCFFERFMSAAIRATTKDTKVKAAAVKFEEQVNKEEKILYAVNCFIHKIEINEISMKALFDSDAEINIISEETARMTQLFMRKD